MNTKPLVAALLFVAASCGTSAETERRLAELQAAAAQKDSLLQEVAITTRILTDVSSEIAKVRVNNRNLRVRSESPAMAQRDTMIAKLRYVVARVDEQERRLNESQTRIRNLTSLSDSLKSTLDSTVSNLQSLIDTQKATIASLTEQVTGLEAENAALRDTVANVTERENSVYYVIGTKDDLKQRGLIVEEGGSRALFILWKTGRTLSPARDLDPNQFHRINKRDVTSIPLPDSSGVYRIASRQDLEFLATPPSDDGRIRNARALEITHPEQFWRNSKFLIIVQESGQTGTGNISMQ